MIGSLAIPVFNILTLHLENKWYIPWKKYNEKKVSSYNVLLYVTIMHPCEQKEKSLVGEKKMNG